MEDKGATARGSATLAGGEEKFLIEAIFLKMWQNGGRNVSTLFINSVSRPRVLT